MRENWDAIAEGEEMCPAEKKIESHYTGYFSDEGPKGHFCCRVVAQSCRNLCDPIDCSTPGFSVRHYFLGFAQTHVYCVGDAIQPSYPLSPPPVLSLSQRQGLFQ